MSINIFHTGIKYKHLSMAIGVVLATVYSMPHTLKEMDPLDLKQMENQMKTSDYVLLYIVSIAIIYASVGVMMEMYG